MMMSEQVTLVFSSDHSVAGAGFTASYVMVDASRECGGRHTTDTGVLRSPGFPDPYPHNRCVMAQTIMLGRTIDITLLLQGVRVGAPSAARETNSIECDFFPSRAAL